MFNYSMIDLSMLDNSQRSESLLEKLKDHYFKRSQSNGTKNVARFLFVFQAVTQFYVTLRYIIPYVFSYYDPWSIYYFKVLAAYLGIVSMANWLCIILYDTSVPNTKDRPFPVYEQQASRYRHNMDSNSIQNGHCVTDLDEVLGDKFCAICDLQTPPRSHHCNICGKCILKRDHHCYLVGKCIGFKNQRYFLVLAFYSVIVSFWGLYITFVYLQENWWPVATFSDTILPITFYRTLFGNIQSHHTIMIFHCYMLAVFGPIATVYFLSQCVIVIKGLTLYELLKSVQIKNTASVSQNIRSVFGDFWAVNFIIPGQLLFRQKEDGYTWNSVKIKSSNQNEHQH